VGTGAAGTGARGHGGTGVDGLLLVDKPAGPTSHDVVSAARRALGERRVGHAGTLDPGATGLLVVLAGRATRLARFVALLDKRYRGTIRFGWETTTDDAAGEPLEREESWRGRAPDEIAAALARVAARPTQRPPRVSAKKVAGERAYRLARRGEAPELEAVPVAIHAITVESFDPAAGDLVVDVRCGGGTYVRAIARDVGRELGTRAHLAALRRLAVGPWTAEEALALADIAAAPDALRPLAEAVRHLPVLEVERADAAALAHGRKIEGAAGPGGPVAVVHAGRLVAVAEWRDGRYAPLVVLVEGGAEGEGGGRGGR